MCFERFPVNKNSKSLPKKYPFSFPFKGKEYKLIYISDAICPISRKIFNPFQREKSATGPQRHGKSLSGSLFQRRIPAPDDYCHNYMKTSKHFFFSLERRRGFPRPGRKRLGSAFKSRVERNMLSQKI